MTRTVWIEQAEDWAEATAAADEPTDLLVVNMGPQHPSTHGPMRFTLELDGETVASVRSTIGFLHTGIEKSMEYRTWTQGVTFCSRMDYVASLFNEAAYVRSLERLLDIEDDVPPRALLLRVLVLELNRIASHLVAIGTGGMEIGALTVMTISMRERELCLSVLEAITGLRMNHGYIRPGGVAADLPAGALDALADFEDLMTRRLPEYADLCNANPLFHARLDGVGVVPREACLALGVTGPVLRATGYPWDLRRTQPYWGYDRLDFDVATWAGADAYARFRVRLEELHQSLRIIGQCRRLLSDAPGPVMVADPKIAWPAQLSVDSDGQGTTADHVRELMATSMESLIHHFKMVTEGFRAPVGQAYAPIESPRGELGCHLVSDGGTRPYRAHVRDPSFANLQCLPLMTEGGQVADFIVALASLDPVCGGVDR